MKYWLIRNQSDDFWTRSLGSKVFAKSEKVGVEGIGLQVFILVAGGNNYNQQVLDSSTFGKNASALLQVIFQVPENYLGEQQLPCFSHWPRFILWKIWVTTTLYKLHQGWFLLCQIYHDLPRFHLGSWPNDRTFEAGDWEKKVREYSLHGVSKPGSSCPSAFAKLLSFCSVQAWNAILEMQENLFLELKQRT